MHAYFVVRDSVRWEHAVLAAAMDNARPELASWFTTPFERHYCRVHEEDFERARHYPGAIVLALDRTENPEVTIAPPHAGEELVAIGA